ncbi:hypothetical protein [Trichothermofontia sp.]
MQQPSNEMREDLGQLATMTADWVRASQQQTRNLEIQTQQIGVMSEAITALRLSSEAQGQRMEQGFERMEQGFVEMRHGFERMDHRFEELLEITRRQGQQMLAVVQQLAQVVDRLVPERDHSSDSKLT